MQFWNKIQPDLDRISNINDMLEESDLTSCRDLYLKIKHILSQENAERLFGITDTQLLQLHQTLDKRFELMVTDNGETDEFFKVKKQKVYEITAKVENDPASTFFRPHDIQPEVVDTLQENYKQLLGLGFLTQGVTSSDVGQILKVQQSGARPGRPVTVPISYEDMLNIDKWDDSKFVFKKAQDGMPDGVTDMGTG